MDVLEKRKISCVGFEPRRVQHVPWSLHRLYVGILQNKPSGVLKVKMDTLQVEGTFIHRI
jgi:hypothetical protein